MGMKIKKGDTVQVISGKDKGMNGKVIEAYPDTERVLVEGVNRIKKHTKVGQTDARRQDRRHRHAGGSDPRHQRDAASVEVDGKKVGTRIGYRVEKVERDGREKTVRVRFAKRTGEDI